MLKDNLKADVKESMKAKDAFTTNVLRLVLAAISQKELDKRYQLAKEKPDLDEARLNADATLNDEETTAVLMAEVKKRRDAIALYEQGGRPELADTEKQEIAVIQKYLPSPLSAEELKQLAQESIAATGAKEMKDMGKAIADLNAKVKGRAEGAEVARVVKELLQA